MCECVLQIDGMISATYDDFLSAVARGRGLSKEAVRAVAKGRVWSGSQAMEVRMLLLTLWPAPHSGMQTPCLSLNSVQPCG